MNFDEIVTSLGGFGTYQRRLCVFVSVVMAAMYMNIMVLVILLATPEHRCDSVTYYTSDDDNATNTYYDDAHRSHTDVIIFNPSTSSDIIVFNLSARSDVNNYTCGVMVGHNTTLQCSSWFYTKAEFDSTVVTEFDWVCERRGYRSYAVMSYMIGLMIGSFFGSAGDTFGRKRTLFVSMGIQAAGGMCLLLSTGFVSFVVVQIVIAIPSMSVITSGCSLGVEMMGTSKRFYLNTHIDLIGAGWFIVVVGASYFIREWRYIQLFTMLPNVLAALSWWFIVESPRWLLTRGRREEAEVALRHVARVNRVQLRDGILSDVRIDEGLTKRTPDRIWHLFQHCSLLLRTIALSFVWMSTCMTFYGLSMSAGALHGNFFVNLLLSALSEVPPVILFFFLVNRAGRKPLLAGGLITAGLFCLASLLPMVFAPGMVVLTATLAMIGKACAMVTFMTMYLYMFEFYPTSIRSAAVGLCYVCGRLGSVVSPYIAYAGDFVGGRVGQVMPLVVFGVVAVVAGLVAVMLPETKNKPLVDTIDDYEARFSKAKAGSSTADKEDGTKSFAYDV